jgi:hypothetical protein
LDAADLESLERATVEAVAPPEVLEIDGWLVPLDNGTIGRAKSAVPLRHDLGPEVIGEIEAAYRHRGLKPAFRIADIEAFAPVCAELSRRGYSAQQPTIFKTGRITDLAAFSEGSANILAKPDDAWSAVFLGEGFRTRRRRASHRRAHPLARRRLRCGRRGRSGRRRRRDELRPGLGGHPRHAHRA